MSFLTTGGPDWEGHAAHPGAVVDVLTPIQVSPHRVYIEVDARFNRAGKLQPRTVIWPDGREYAIEAVTAVHIAAPHSKQADRYDVVIRGQSRRLYYERYPLSAGRLIGKWYVEAAAQT